MTTERTFTAAGAIAALLAVVIGAFGAHALRPQLEAVGRLAVYQTGVHYHLAHALGLLAVGSAAARHDGPRLRAAGWLLLAGIVLFSGSLYLLALSGLRLLGIVTPFGGLCFLAGWLLFAMAALRD